MAASTNCLFPNQIYKYKVSHFQARYDAEVDDIENEINYTRLKIKKLDEHRNFLTNEIKRFHMEIQQCEDKEKAQKQAKIDAEIERLRLVSNSMVSFKNSK